MKYLIYLSAIVISFTTVGQTIEVPAGIPLTIVGNLNLPTGYSIQYNGQNYVKSPGSGTNNTYLGILAGVSGGGAQNTFIGNQTGPSISSGNYNTFVGYQSGLSTTSGSYNVFLGQRAGSQNTTGGSNLFMGSYAGENNTNGQYNLFIGNSSGQGTTSGNGNTFIGDGSGYGNQIGTNNTYIGRASGYSGNASGSNNTFIGYGAGVTSTSVNINNSVAIGVNAQVSQSNSIVLGNGANVGIGNATPQTKLEITQGSSGNSGLRFTNLTSGSTPGGSTNQFLTVNNLGDVVLATVGATKGLRQMASDSGVGNWELATSGYLSNTNVGGVVIGPGISRMPTGYRLYVSEGILTERVKVAVKSTDNWSDKVFSSKYKLKSLLEVEKYIRKNSHLPDLLSAKEMVEQGNDLHDTDSKLLTKIEELTLYVIEQQKELNQLRNQNKTIRKEILRLKNVSKNGF